MKKKIQEKKILPSFGLRFPIFSQSSFPTDGSLYSMDGVDDCCEAALYPLDGGPDGIPGYGIAAIG
jgi:hypothetical protein